MSSRKYPTGQASTSETSCFETDTITCETSDDMAKGDLRGRALYDRLMLFKPAGLDEYEWAKRAGVNRGYFNDIKEKNTSPRTETLTKVLAVAGKTVADLYLADAGIQRSEEHTSELQSLMRISYAVFCLKKKKDRTTLTI